MIPFKVVVILTVLFTTCSSWANDGFSALGVGGVTTSKTDKIAIKSELLDISCDMINVAYDFINESDSYEEAVIMFPLPSYPANPLESGGNSHGQPSGFTIKVNGRPVSYETEVKAYLKGKDVTNELRSAGLSLKEIAEFPFNFSLTKDNKFILPISKSQIETLAQKGLFEDGIPEWDIDVNYVWRQNFPARGIVHVEHSYHPFIATGTAAGFTSDTDLSAYCIDNHQLNKLKELYSNKKNLDVNNEIPGTNVQYILTTANSWKDSIRNFTLRVHAKSKNEIVALCFPGKLRKVSDTLYEAHLENFRPQADLSIYFGNARKCGDDAYGEPPHFRNP